MTTRRSFLKIAGAGALVGAGALGLNKLGSDEIENSSLYSDVEKALSGENPDIPAETIRAISKDYAHISDKLKAGTAGVSALMGAFYEKVYSDGATNGSIYPVMSAVFAHSLVADKALDRYKLQNADIIQKDLQEKYGLTLVQAIHVEKTLREQIKADFRFQYGAFASVAGSVGHRLAGYAEKKFNEPDNDGMTPFG